MRRLQKVPLTRKKPHRVSKWNSWGGGMSKHRTSGCSYHKKYAIHKALMLNKNPVKKRVYEVFSSFSDLFLNYNK